MNSTGNNTNGQPVAPTLPVALPELPIFPDLELETDKYASLQARLDLYPDFIVMTKYDQGTPDNPYLVDPAETAAALAGISLGSGLLPPDTLFWSKVDGLPRLGVYIPDRVWTVAVRGHEEALHVPLPPLVFIGHRYDYSVWAVTERPTSENTPIYVAPVPNVAFDTGVCRGSAPFPQAGEATIWEGVDIFFSSRFNHDLAQKKSQAYPDNVVEQWLALSKAGVETYPLDDLVRVKNMTMGGLANV